MLHLRADDAPVDLLAKRPGDLEHRSKIRLLLGQGEELGGEDVLDRRDGNGLGRNLEQGRALEMLVTDRATCRAEDQIDEYVAVPCLHEPALGRSLEAQTDVRERPLSALDVSLAEEEIDIVLGRRAAARPRRETAAEQERNLGVAEHRGTPLHRLDELKESVVWLGAHSRSDTRRWVT